MERIYLFFHEFNDRAAFVRAFSVYCTVSRLFFSPPATFLNDAVVSSRVLLSLRVQASTRAHTREPHIRIYIRMRVGVSTVLPRFSPPSSPLPHERKLPYAHVSPRADLSSSALVNFVSVNPVSFTQYETPHRTYVRVYVCVCGCVRAPPRGVTSNGSLFFILSRAGLFTLSTVITRIPRSGALLFEFPILFLDSLFRLAIFLGTENWDSAM